MQLDKEAVNKPVSLLLYDYISAGNTNDENSWFRVWLPQPLDPGEQAELIRR
ncbi:MAG: hypothetical protein ABI675_29855 [Chitinophagaceae bacterium]